MTVPKWGCAAGFVDGAAPPACEPTFTWAELVAGTNDLNGLPSDFADPDSRAGTFQVLFNGGVGFDPTGQTTDEPFEAATLTLRNGVGAILEQWQVNRRWAPTVGCEADSPFPRCWVTAFSNAVDGLLTVLVPELVEDSNADFDDSGDRVTVSGELVMDYTEAQDFTDNAHQTLLVTWEAPNGLDTAQLLLRGRYDADHDGLNAADVLQILFSRNQPGGVDTLAPGVAIFAESSTSITLAINLQSAVEDLCLGL